ncbi:MAG: elongation factor P [Planctomycetes bacterium]|nr:elongation factor P [Planctomycetota bacterium]
MPSCKMRDVKKGEAIRYNNDIWVVFDRHEQTRGNLRTYWQVDLKHLIRGNVFTQRFSPDDNVEKVILLREEYEYLYDDGTSYVFMHPESFEQVNISKDLIAEQHTKFLIPNIRMNLVKAEDRFVVVELPQTVDVTIADAPDAARGDTATAVTKIAKMENGGEVRVPGHIKKGDKVRIRVEDGEFLSRVNE